MPKVLNQDELDALLSMVQSSSGETAVSGASGGSRAPAGSTGGFNVLAAEDVRILDFKRPERASMEQASALEMLHDTFARNVSSSLSGYLRTTIDVRLISVEQFTYSEFTMSVPNPTIFNSLSCKPLPGNVILEMNPSIIFPCIDRLLGGNTPRADLLDRPFTPIEQSLIQTIQARLLHRLEEAWTSVTPVEFEVVESETNPMLMQIVAPNEPVILLSFEVHMGENSGLINLCIPFKVIKSVIDEFTHMDWFSRGEGSGDGEERRHLLGNIEKTRLETRADLGELRLRLGDVLGLQVGDIIELEQPADGEVVLRIGEEPAFLARPATFRGRNALTLTAPIDPRHAIL